MSIKFASFDAMTKQNKITALMHIKEKKSKKKADYFLALHALLDQNIQICLAAKMVAATFSEQNFYIDLSKLSQNEIKEKISSFMKENIGLSPHQLTSKVETPLQTQAQNLQKKQKKHDSLGEWDTKFTPSANLLNTLRSDSQEMIDQIFSEDDPPLKAFLCFYQKPLAPFRELIRSLDSNAATTLVNLSRIRNPEQISPAIESLFEQINRPIYLLVILSAKIGALFLRNDLRTSDAAVMTFNFQQITNVKTIKDGPLVSIEIETPQDLIKLPFMESRDAYDATNFIREKSIESIEAEEDYIERDFEKELKKLNMLFKAKAIKNSEYIFRKSRLQKMELEKFSDANIELLLAKRFSDDKTGNKFDQQLLKKFTFEKTVMFTDIVGFSTKADEKQLLDTMTLLAVHDKLLMPIVKKYQGTLIKKIGDALMIRFDEATNACKAAQEMQKRLNIFNNKSQEKIFIRIGLNTGTVFIKNEDVFGDAVNIAARMESLAQPGRIFLTEATFSKAKNEIQCEDIGLHQLKGKKEPIHAFAISEPANSINIMADLANEYMQNVGMKIPGLSSSATEASKPQNHLKLMASDIESAIDHYKQSIKQGNKRNAVLERWFSVFASKIKPNLKD